MTCRELVEFLMEYVSGELPADQRAVFDEHLAGCPECVAYVKSYEESVRLATNAFRHPDDQVSDEVPADLVKAILAARRK